MKIKLISLYVDDQSKALRFYTEVLGFAKKADFSNGLISLATVASPEEPDGTELQLALNNNPAAKRISKRSFSRASPRPFYFRRHPRRLRADQDPRASSPCRPPT